MGDADADVNIPLDVQNVLEKSWCKNKPDGRRLLANCSLRRQGSYKCSGHPTPIDGKQLGCLLFPFTANTGLLSRKWRACPHLGKTAGQESMSHVTGF